MFYVCVKKLYFEEAVNGLQTSDRMDAAGTIFSCFVSTHNTYLEYTIDEW